MRSRLYRALALTVAVVLLSVLLVGALTAPASGGEAGTDLPPVAADLATPQLAAIAILGGGLVVLILRPRRRHPD